ncbi:hypothetical protein A678_00548 [Salmonella enterica subsp. enterica serovar Enteritidis str. 2010K-0271]|nr:hypothetical protein A678_00548 [Salmonella enterica subsp. enterica serovar Enteritidis str. 2010K-0271]
MAFASGCKAVYPAFAPPAYRSLLIFSCRHSRFSRHSWICRRRRFTGPNVPAGVSVCVSLVAL